jgi:hypothetical protein
MSRQSLEFIPRHDLREFETSNSGHRNFVTRESERKLFLYNALAEGKVGSLAAETLQSSGSRNHEQRIETDRKDGIK